MQGQQIIVQLDLEALCVCVYDVLVAPQCCQMGDFIDVLEANGYFLGLEGYKMC